MQVGAEWVVDCVINLYVMIVGQSMSIHIIKEINEFELMYFGGPLTRFMYCYDI
jgi:hypothetical protein